MSSQCVQCASTFDVSPDHLAFLEQVSPVLGGKRYTFPAPTRCPLCRRQNRSCWRNERSLYPDTCDQCGRHMISIFAPNERRTAYCHSCFWSDAWSPLDAGRPFDFTRPFFEQWSELLHATPLISLINVNTENSEYCNRIYDGRNNYLSFVVLLAPENLYHTYYTTACKDCTDVTFCQSCELCYELVDGEHCHGCSFSRRMKNCSDCLFCEDCTGCTSCLRCKNLHQQSHCIENVRYSREDYERTVKELELSSTRAVREERRRADAFFLHHPHRSVIRIQCENVTGANVYYCRDSLEIYDFFESERMRYCTYGEKSHDCMDCFGFGLGEFCYESMNFMGGHLLRFCIDCPTGSDVLYSYGCFNNTANCFGCVSLKKGKYCILNKQYAKEEYESLLGRIINHMRETGEWGRFFPPERSLFGYNETTGMVYKPLDRTLAQREGFRWREPDEREYRAGTIAVPDRIDDASDALAKEVLACEECGKNYKIIAQELEFYRRRAIPPPRHCPDCRHAARMARRAPAQLWKRTCAHCGKETDSTYEPSRREIVYCEECYLAAVY